MPLTITPDTLPKILAELDRRLRTVENASPVATGTVTGAVTATGLISGPTLAITGAATLGTLALGGGTVLTLATVYTPSLTPAACAASIGMQQQTFTVTGLTTADKVFVNGPAPAALAAMVAARVSATNTLALTFANLSAAANVPAAGVYTVLAIRS